MKRIYIIFIILILFSVSCGKQEFVSEPDETVPVETLVPREDIPLTRAQTDYINKGGNTFALNLFKAVAKEEDVVISPLGVTFALGMADNGAYENTNTKAEIERVLGYEEDSVDGLNSFCGTMMGNSVKIDPSTRIAFANAAVFNSHVISPTFGYRPPRKEFINVVEANYDASILTNDFENDDVKNIVNSWCDKKTDGMIPGFLKDQPDANSYVLFLNALYFKGIWSSQFKKSDTKKEDFRNISNKKVTVNMMRQEAYFNYGGINGLCSAVCLPYGNQAYRMILLLPLKGQTIGSLKEALDIDKWNDINTSLHREKVNVKIPSFEIEYYSSLKQSLQTLGIYEAFNPLYAHFELMCERGGVWIDDVVQKAKIIVDEQGSEAAAITEVKFGTYTGTSGGSNQTVEFHADRPFIYAITEVSTGAIFFIGQYTGK